MPVGQIEEALSQLDVGERALLDLSVHRGFDDERIAALLGVDVTEVGALRRAALEKLFRLRAVSGDGARDAVRAELRSVSDSSWIDPVAATPRRDRRRPVLVVAGILVIAAAITAIALSAGSSDSDTASDDTGSATPTPTQASSPGPQGAEPASQAAQPAPVDLEPLSSDTPGRVTASVSGSPQAQRLTVKLRGLPTPGGAYELWLYDSLVHSRPLGSVAAGKGSISARLPGDTSSYSWLDLTLQPGTDRVHHSGESVFRVPLDQVLPSG